jgi:hypothetical protein
MWRCVIACAISFACALLCAPVAGAATAPTLDSPADNASFTEGNKITYNWTGTLQGDSTALDRSYFKVELVPSSKKPTGAQASWENVSGYLYGITEFGDGATKLEMGVPDAGSYEWRVCAWGVVDDQQDNSIVQLSNGCSASRGLTAAAAIAPQTTIGELKETNTSTVQGTNNVITKTTTTTTPAPPADNKIVTLPKTDDQIVKFDKSMLGSSTFGSGGKHSALNMGDQGFELSGARDDTSGGAFGGFSRFAGSLSKKIPIPWWSLALLGAAVPLARIWRRTTLNMFEFDDRNDQGASSGTD